MQKYAAARAVRPTAVSVVRSSKSEVRRAKWGTAAPAVIHTGRRDEGAGTTDTARGPVGASRPRLADEGRMSKAECRNGAQRPCRDAGPPRRRLLYHLITLSPYHRPGRPVRVRERGNHTPRVASRGRLADGDRSSKSEVRRAKWRRVCHGCVSRGCGCERCCASRTTARRAAAQGGGVPTFARSHVPTLASRGRLAPMPDEGVWPPWLFANLVRLAPIRSAPLVPRPSPLVPAPFVPSCLRPSPLAPRPCALL